jgi:hypothetical protein
MNEWSVCAGYVNIAASNSVNWLLECAEKYIRNFYITYWIYNNYTKWDPVCLLHSCKIPAFTVMRENVLGELTSVPLSVLRESVSMSKYGAAYNG